MTARRHNTDAGATVDDFSSSVRVERRADGGKVEVPKEDCPFCGDLCVEGHCGRRCRASEQQHQKDSNRVQRQG